MTCLFAGLLIFAGLLLVAHVLFRILSMLGRIGVLLTILNDRVEDPDAIALSELLKRWM